MVTLPLSVAQTAALWAKIFSRLAIKKMMELHANDVDLEDGEVIISTQTTEHLMTISAGLSAIGERR